MVSMQTLNVSSPIMAQFSKWKALRTHVAVAWSAEPASQQCGDAEAGICILPYNGGMAASRDVLSRPGPINDPCRLPLFCKPKAGLLWTVLLEDCSQRLHWQMAQKHAHVQDNLRTASVPAVFGSGKQRILPFVFWRACS